MAGDVAEPPTIWVTAPGWFYAALAIAALMAAGALVSLAVTLPRAVTPGRWTHASGLAAFDTQTGTVCVLAADWATAGGRCIDIPARAAAGGK